MYVGGDERGRRWVFGNYVFDGHEHWIDVKILRFKVIGTSVGEYTGLRDKDKKEIYEGDRVQTMEWLDEVKRAVVETVEFHGGAFYPVCQKPSEEWKVVGNIYENPDLLTPETRREAKHAAFFDYSMVSRDNAETRESNRFSQPIDPIT